MNSLEDPRLPKRLLCIVQGNSEPRFGAQSCTIRIASLLQSFTETLSAIRNETIVSQQEKHEIKKRERMQKRADAIARRAMEKEKAKRFEEGLRKKEEKRRRQEDMFGKTSLGRLPSMSN